MVPHRDRRGGRRWVRRCSCRFRANSAAERHRHCPGQADRARYANQRPSTTSLLHVPSCSGHAYRQRRCRRRPRQGGAEADALRQQVDGLVFAAFDGARTARLSAVRISTSPQDLLDRMTALDLLGRDTSARMDGARTARGIAERSAADAATARDAAARSEQDALQVRQDVVARRAALQMQTAEAATLLGQLTAERAQTMAAKPGTAPGGLAQLVTSQRASAQRATRSALPICEVADGPLTVAAGHPIEWPSRIGRRNIDSRAPPS